MSYHFISLFIYSKKRKICPKPDFFIYFWTSITLKDLIITYVLVENSLCCLNGKPFTIVISIAWEIKSPRFYSPFHFELRTNTRWAGCLNTKFCTLKLQNCKRKIFIILNIIKEGESLWFSLLLNLISATTIDRNPLALNQKNDNFVKKLSFLRVDI